MQAVGKMLVILGLVLLLAGGLFLLSGKIPWLGRLPGDIVIRRENFTFYFPVTTCILVSIVISFLLFLFTRK
ncbi:MAG: DUF2905 family protein [Candidatus Omnitrophica bacterium]|nr:DUF2905 family protein [Candidatus Omnitrophota bacterium]